MRAVHLIKLCVGIDSIEQLEDWRQRHAQTREIDGNPLAHVHVTRMWPKRADEILSGGSLYWVIKGEIQCRQRIVDLAERIGADGIRRCAIVMDPTLHRTAHVRRRPFQGWRYLTPEDAPPDLPAQRDSDDVLPADLAQSLADIGLR